MSKKIVPLAILLAPLLMASPNIAHAKSPAECNRVYKIKKDDRCAEVIYHYSKNDMKEFKYCNPDLNCFSNRLKEGTKVYWRM